MNRYHRHLALTGALKKEPRAGPRLAPEPPSARQGRRAAARRHERATFGVALVVAALGHLALVWPVASNWLLTSDPRPQRAQMRVVSIPSSQWAKNRKLEWDERERPEPKVEPKEKPPEPKAELPPGQIVSLPPPVNEERPERADYAASHDQSVERETRSRHRSKDYLNPTRVPQVGLEEIREAPSTSEKSRAAVEQLTLPGGPEGTGRAMEGDEGEAKTSGAGTPGFELELPKIARRDRLALRATDDGTVANQREQLELLSEGRRLRLSLGMRPEARPGAGGAQVGRGRRGGSGGEGMPNLAQLTPSLVELQRLSGMPANDYLPEVETDEQTALNAWRWKHTPFFNRVQKRVSHEWEPSDAAKRSDPYLYQIKHQRRQTTLEVTIDAKGNVLEVMIAEASGADYLDAEAVRAFREAGPFTNPPRALFGAGDRFTFRFGFAFDGTTTQLDLNWRPY